ncbi:MAG TPA: hypothetical protein VN540_01495 [Clostridia bacterium]|nr:hypothetical protein [Clostridia bacterium]
MKKAEQTRVDRLYALFEEYRNAYAAEWERLEKCERLYRGDHWSDVPVNDQNEPRPVTPVIQSTVESIRADLMDQLPEAVVTADAPENEGIAEALRSLLAENHRRGRFEREYADLLYDLLVGGYMVMEVGYDESENNGLGAAFIRHADAHNVLFDPLCADIQDSRAVFKLAPYPVEWFRARYPKKFEEMKGDPVAVVPRRDHHLGRGTSEEMLLIECWEREYDAESRLFRVHMVKLAGGVLLEDSRAAKPEGYFAHGRYPFVVTPLFPRRGTALGYGFPDLFETQQRYSDKLDQIILKNALMASHNKLLITGASGFDPDDLRDWSKEVHKGDSLGGVTWFPTPPLPAYVAGFAKAIREGIKEESGSTDFSRGETYGGVTAAAAIAALQEASGKRARMVARVAHGAFEEAVRQEIEVEREFCAFSRTVRLQDGRLACISGEDMYAVSGLDNRLPVEFAVTVKAQRENRFTVAAHNETVISLVRLGMVTPDVGLELMLFEGKRQALDMMKRAAASGAQLPMGLQ